LPGRDPLARKGVVHPFYEYAGETGVAARGEQRAVVRTDGAERVHRNAGEARWERQSDAIAVPHVEHDRIDEPLVEQALYRLDGTAQPNAAGATRVAKLHRASRLTPGVKHRHDGIRGASAHVCTKASCIS